MGGEKNCLTNTLGYRNIDNRLEHFLFFLHFSHLTMLSPSRISSARGKKLENQKMK
jgi:hypothetical protein